MSDVIPKFWEEILKRMAIESFDGIEKFRDVLNYMGYKTCKSVAKLQRQKEIDRFEIELAKLGGNSTFREKFPELKPDLCHGDILVLKEIASAAAAYASHSNSDKHDINYIQQQVYERCKNIASNLDVSSVLIDLSGKPKCEIICPFENCKNVSKLSTTRQVDETAAPKFNTFNFERHYQTQHTRKRKPLADITNCGTETPSKVAKNSVVVSKSPQDSSPQTHQKHTITTSTPKQCNVAGTQYVKQLEEKLLTQQATIRQMNEENILLRHKIMDVRGTVRVFCRIKPDMGLDCFQWIRSKDGTVLKLGDDLFALDYVFGPNSQNTDVFEYIKPMIQSAVEGFNVSIIAYGASGSGKSTTMEGTETDPGVIPNVINFLINEKQRVSFEIICSFFEIYNEKLLDLSLKNDATSDKLRIRSTGSGVANLNEFHIQTMDDFKENFKSAIKRRNVAPTQRNHGSSRSHAAVQVNLKGKRNGKAFESNLLICDLAGAENADDHLNIGETSQRATEMSNINKSLSTFGTVIENLKKNEFADFRSSQLTQLLKPSLTANTKTLVITTISQESKFLAISKNSLCLAKSAKQIKIKDVKKNITA